MFDILKHAEDIGDVPRDIRQDIAELEAVLRTQSEEISSFLADAVAEF
jgi:hypothetical protein